MKLSHSRIESFNNCPYKFKLHYIDGIETIPDTEPDNALYVGTAVHTGIEKGLEVAINEYYGNYPIITDKHIDEVIKLKYVVPMAKKMLPEGQYEVEIKDDDFVGYIDLLAPALTEQKLAGEHQVIPNQYDIYDFKYSNNIDTYKKSSQLHLYKYFFEKNNPGMKVRNLYFFFVPKVRIKQKKTEDIFEFRHRIQTELEQVKPTKLKIEYDPTKVIQFLLDAKRMLETTDYNQKLSWLCNYCEYADYCKKGIDYMLLPSAERRTIGATTKRKLWIYGPSFSGKTTFLDKAPNPLNLNTDGNIQFVTMPFVPIKDVVTTKGRITERTLAWKVLKDTIAELEKGDNDFKTIIIDLVEDTYESCRLYMYDKLGITHESDDSFKAWDKVRTEYLSTIRKFFNLDYENLVVVSHEDASKDITKKSGDKITAIKPNISDKIANKIAGMVDIVGRVVVEDDGTRTLNFKSNEVIFGGGRLKGIKTTSIPLEWNALCEVYDEVNSGVTAKIEPTPAKTEEVNNSSKAEEKPVETETTEPVEVVEEAEVVEEEKPKTRVRKRRV